MKRIGNIFDSLEEKGVIRDRNLKRSQPNTLNATENAGKLNKNKPLKKLIGADGFVAVFD